jgi:hypothetical protein
MEVDMEKHTSKLPLEIQLQVVTQPHLSPSYDLLVSYLPELKDWNPKRGSFELYQGRVKQHLTFMPNELIEYLEMHPEACKALLLASYDKRYTPSTFIDEWKDNQYRVGWVRSAGNPLIINIRVFSSFAEAAADYVLYSWGFPRLTKDQANWYEMDHF